MLAQVTFLEISSNRTLGGSLGGGLSCLLQMYLLKSVRAALVQLRAQCDMVCVKSSAGEGPGLGFASALVQPDAHRITGTVIASVDSDQVRVSCQAPVARGCPNACVCSQPCECVGAMCPHRMAPRWRHYVVLRTILAGDALSSSVLGVILWTAGAISSVESAAREFGRDVVVVVDASFGREVWLLCVCRCAHARWPASERSGSVRGGAEIGCTRGGPAWEDVVRCMQ